MSQNHDEHKHEDELKAQPETGKPQPAGGPAAPETGGAGALADALKVSFTFLKVAMLVLILLYLLEGIFYVKPGEVRIKLSFGRPVKMDRGGGRGKSYVIDAESGWHFRWPWEEVQAVPGGEQTLVLDKEFWYGPPRQMGGREAEARAAAGMPDVAGSLSVRDDGYLVTGDVNIAHMQLRVRYRAREDEQGALDYAFRMPEIIPDKPKQGPQELLRQLVVQSSIETVGTWEVLDVLRKTMGLQQIGAPQEEGKGPVPVRGLLEEIEAKVQEKLQQFEEANGFSSGVRLTAIEFVGDPIVPQQVQQSFYAAIMADSEMRKLVDEAKKQAQIVEESAKGKKARILSEAETYKNRLISNAKADADMLTKLVTAYGSSPEEADILRAWHYQRTMEDFLGSGKGIFVVHRQNEGSKTQLRFSFGKPPRRAKQAQ